MSDRHEKWVRVEPGHVIPAGQPYRVETPHLSQQATEQFDTTEMQVYGQGWFVDSSWRPPLNLPETPTWGIAVYDVPGVLKLFGQWQMVSTAVLHRIGTDVSWFADRVLDFIPLTDEQVARFEAAR